VLGVDVFGTVGVHAMADPASPLRPRPAVVLRAPVVVWAVAAVALIALTIAVVVVGGPLPGEVAIIRWLQALDEPVPAIADLVRATTSTEGNLIVGVVPAVWLVRRHGRRGVAAVLICLVAMLVIQPVSKGLVDRDRPSTAQVEVRAESTSRSYPSGHSLSTTTVWGAAAWYVGRTGRRRRALALAFPIPCTAVASGIHGVHWASDSVAGTIIGGATAWATVRMIRPR
jgi:membrane-associated phospholipid phosphatase